MFSKDLRHVGHDFDARLVHVINTQLLDFLFGDTGFLKGMLINSDAWIINVLYAHDRLEKAPVLKTSSTLNRGTLYDHTSRRGGDVFSLDETVPLVTSLTGRCILSGRPIWLGSLGLRKNAFGEKYYRQFSLVDVQTGGFPIPRAEIVFPISDIHLNSVTVHGALNMELFGDLPTDVERYLSNLPRESINELICDLLHIHAGFLKIAIDILNLNPSEMTIGDEPKSNLKRMKQSITGIRTLHKTSLDLFADRHSEDIKEIVAIIEENIPSAPKRDREE